ncbi:MAG TPA: AAA family ATPase [Ruminococcaceae bacterium]|nr:AAA family ATPase [Oscillospiraceae bacterium]
MEEFTKIVKEVKKAVNGKDRAIIVTLLALLANGNILIEDIPGVGKTTMAIAFSKALGLDYGRVQFSPDTLPSDITGFAVFNKETGKMRFNKGAIFCNLFLADELNRTSSRTQAALLEAMEERQVTVEGVSYTLEKPFSVIATQNPVGASGTQLLPDSQTDRFMIQISMGYPDEKDELSMLLNRADHNPMDNIVPVVTKEQFALMQQEVNNVFIKPEIAKYIVSLVSATRQNELIARGASPRATIALAQMAKASAFASGRDYVVPKDISNVFLPTLCHRIILGSAAEAKRMNAGQILTQVMREVSPPRI